MEILHSETEEGEGVLVSWRRESVTRRRLDDGSWAFPRWDLATARLRCLCWVSSCLSRLLVETEPCRDEPVLPVPRTLTSDVVGVRVTPRPFPPDNCFRPRLLRDERETSDVTLVSDSGDDVL